MDVFELVSDVRRVRWSDRNATWGLVPTMGFLHDGHLSLVRRAGLENGRIAVSIFVNPAQFNDPGDLAGYPTNLERDLEMLEAAGVDSVWTPQASSVYPAGFQTYVDVEEVTLPLEGGSRPGHFRGVATVVCKLFNVFEPDRAYFGQKDAQQALTIRRMVEDLNFNLTVVVAETVREADGLALSSRNTHLSEAARGQAVCLYAGLSRARAAFEDGERDADVLRSLVREAVERASLARLEYASVADPQTLTELGRVDGGALISVAARFGNVRLIDNVLL